MEICFRIQARLKHWWHAHPRGGFGIHSPFAFHFVTGVLEEQNPYYAYQEIERYRRHLLQSQESIEVTDWGTGKSGIKRVRDMARKSLSSPEEGQRLFRTAVFTRAKTVLELGSSLGISTLYLSKAVPSAQLFSIEGCPATAGIAQGLFNQARANNIHLHVGPIEQVLPRVLAQVSHLDMVYLDANHSYEATWTYFRQCLPLAGPESVFVLDDIHWSAGMQRAWEEIRRLPEVHVSIDTFGQGYLFFRPDIPKAHYCIR